MVLSTAADGSLRLVAGRIALVTGANRGLGLETARQLARQGYRVVLGARSADAGEAAAASLRADGADAVAIELDVTAPDTDALAALGADVLVNNAGIAPEDGLPSKSVFDVPAEVVLHGFENNTLGALKVAQAVVPGMRERGYGRVVNVSSGMGQLSDMNGGSPGYRLSKTALNALTRILADELRGTNVLVNSVCPGWVRTDMGGPHARLPVDEGVDTIVWAATLPDGGPSGGFFRKREAIPW
jgi:NAD(P)-dependent dehydrogenase (short-subunit alcohol dehydrogenase family)